MSWSFSGIGKPNAVAEKAKASLSAYKCSEPEETIKGKVAEIIGAALAAYAPGVAVQVEAAGSQYTDSSKPGEATNTLTLRITPLHGFVE